MVYSKYEKNAELKIFLLEVSWNDWERSLNIILKCYVFLKKHSDCHVLSCWGFINLNRQNWIRVDDNNENHKRLWKSRVPVNLSASVGISTVLWDYDVGLKYDYRPVCVAQFSASFEKSI